MKNRCFEVKNRTFEIKNGAFEVKNRALELKKRACGMLWNLSLVRFQYEKINIPRIDSKKCEKDLMEYICGYSFSLQAHIILMAPFTSKN